jgi:hypothetical protein
MSSLRLGIDTQGYGSGSAPLIAVGQKTATFALGYGVPRRSEECVRFKKLPRTMKTRSVSGRGHDSQLR